MAHAPAVGSHAKPLSPPPANLGRNDAKSNIHLGGGGGGRGGRPASSGGLGIVLTGRVVTV